ncbi:MAG: radical SAM family heme chaperone HemW [Cocleimonas sp.]
MPEPTPIPLSLYIHIPWCIKKCPYCDFNSHEAKNEIPEERYLDALIKDLENELPNIWGRSIESIFIGGGTPSLFSAAGIDRLLRSLRERLNIRPNIEITMEANPGTFEQERFSGFREAGINRLSIGVQSYNDQHLKALGRVHDSNEALKAAGIVQTSGFNNFNLDLMFGLPKQTVEEALRDLELAIATKPNHISWYQLTIEENTLFHYSPPPVPNDELIWEIQQQGQELLKRTGYEQYEVSAYARKNQQSKHNMNYWQFGDYLGIGAGAHGKITMPDGSITRHTKFRHPEEYMKQALDNKARSTEKPLKKDDVIFEFMLNIARLKSGFTAELFEQRTWLAFSEVSERLETLIKDGLIVKTENRYKPSDKGYLFVNDIVNRFL